MKIETEWNAGLAAESRLFGGTGTDLGLTKESYNMK